MRIAIVDTLYPAFVEAHYQSHPRLERTSYERQRDSILGCSFGTSDAYSVGFRAAGHEAHDLLINCERLQETWASSRGIGRRLGDRLLGLAPRATRGLDDRGFLHRIAREQIRELRPDVVYFQDLTFFSIEDLQRMRRAGIRLVAQFGSGPPPMPVLESFDLVVTSFPHWVERLRAAGVDAEYFPIAFDDRVIERLSAIGVSTDPATERPNVVSFVGGIHAPHIHRGGTPFLERVVEELDAGVWGYVNDRIPEASPLAVRHHGEAWGLDMYMVLARSRIALNRHGDIAEGYANNMRLFEATGVGAVLVTEDAPNLPELFTPGEEVVTYRSADDLVPTVRALLADDDRRQAIAAAGQRRTLEEHTYRRRLAQLIPLIEARL